MMRRRASLLLLSVGCTSSAGTAEPPKTEVVIDEPLAPSSLPALGVTEGVSAAPGGERAVRAVTAEVGACVRPAVEREPALSGTIAFRIEPGASVKPATGTLAALPVAACVRDALRMVKAGGAIDYTLTFNGNPNPQPLRADALLNIDWAAIDWSATGPDVPAAFVKSGDALRERLRRCAFGAEPLLSENVWLAARVTKGGAATVGVGKPGDASDCIQRVLRATTFPDAGHDYAFSVMLRPSLENEPAESNDKQEFGMIGLLNAGAGDDVSARGNMWGDEIGDSYGAGGLGLAGIGEGGGRGEGIGLGSIGTLGHGAGTGTGQGFGSGNGRLGGAHRSKPPSVRMGATSVSGRLPPEVIQRIVRQNFGRFRLCYENGLRKDPNLAGKVTVSFEITRAGGTSKISATSEMKDKEVVACVQKAFISLSFPQPEGGVVKVSYPIAFSPGDGGTPASSSGAPAKPAGPPPMRTIGGKAITSVSIVDVEKRLLAKGFEVARIPGTDDVPALFINDEPNRRLYTLTLSPERDGIRGPLCKAGNNERQLYIRGDQCQRVMEPLLD